VELLETREEQVLVRLCGVGVVSGEEGTVPITCLKMPIIVGREEQDGSCDGAGDSSPVNRSRRVWSGKWLPPFRKLSSQGKLEKSQSMGGHDTRNLQKQISKSKFKAPASPGPTVDERMGNKQSEPQSSPTARLPPSGRGKPDDQGEESEDELPPPMGPIHSLPLPDTTSTANGKRDPPPWNGLDEPGSSLVRSESSPPLTQVAESCDEQATETEAEAGLAGDGVIASENSGDPAAKAIEQRSYRLQELLETELMYVTDLEQAATYITYMRDSKEAEEADIRMPDDLREGKDRMIFGNLESIFEWHRDFFSKNLEKCISNPVDLGNLFKKYERKFQMYVVYCQNKPKSEHIVSEHINDYFEEIRLKYGFKLRLTDLLIKPIQRLTKYHMLLEAILKHSQRAGLVEEANALEQAFHVMTVVPNQANDMMDIGRLQGFEGKIVAQGKLLLRGPLFCTDDPTSGPNFKMREMTVFLFEQIMLFAETVGKKTQFTSPNYNYKAHIQVNKMQFEERVDGDTEGRMFRVKSTDPRGPSLTYVCQAEDAQTRARWTGTMAKQLQTQKEFLQALQAPIAYHNKLLKEL